MALPKGPYNSKQSESEILEEWTKAQAYKPEYNPESDSVMSLEEMKNDSRTSWALICPPPNAYGRPHIGNISGYAYMDAMARYQRMNGKKVLVLPGKDHAGLEGEGVFVRDVLEKKGRKKFEMKREDFYQEMMEWMAENMQKALQDEKEIGLSADFDRNVFTLDPDIVETVLDTFVEMYKDGMIYKGVRIINYDVKARTAVADNQIEYKDSETPFYYFRYTYGNEVSLPNEIIELAKSHKEISVTWEDLVTNPVINDVKDTPSNSDVKIPIGSYTSNNSKSYKVFLIGFTDDELKDSTKGYVVGINLTHDGSISLIVSKNDISDEEIGKLYFNTVVELHKKHEPYRDDLIKNILFGHNIFPLNPYFRKELIDSKDLKKALCIGTVRPETIFADTAVAYSITDASYYNKYFPVKNGKRPVEVEFLGEKKILNLIPDYAVDPAKGTGLLKVTPAHSVEDWEIGQRHPEECLPAIQVINYDLTMNNLSGKYSGMKIKEARAEMIEDMKASGNLVYLDETYQNRIAIAERTKAPIEPLLSSQWYLKYDDIRDAGIQMALNAHHDRSNLSKKGDYKKEIAGEDDYAVRIHPANMVPKFNHWMENLRDWAISRSLWWGYRLPVWYHGDVKEEIGKDGQVRELINLKSQISNPKSYNGEVIIREAKVSDAETIWNLQVDGWHDNFVSEKDGVTLERLKEAFGFKHNNKEEIEKIKENINSGSRKYFVIEEDGKVIGWVNIHLKDNDGINWIDIFIERSNQGKGLGKLLMNKLFEEFSDKELHLAVPEQSRAVKFYLSLRFEEYSRNNENEYGLPIIQMKRKPGNLNTQISSLKSQWIPLEYDNPNHLRVQKECPGEGWIQDENVLDTWFSSGQWVYATLMKYNLMDTFFPSDVLVSAYDILENWDSRMMMFTYFKEKNIPFRNLFLTGLVRAADGQKMSKSKGNVMYIDDLREQYGTDAVRMVFYYQNTAGGDYAMTYDKLKNFKQFSNKIWNASKFVLMNLEDLKETEVYSLKESDLKLKNSKKLLGHINDTKDHITKNIEEFELGLATFNVYQGFWHTFCDEFLESSKPYIYTQKDKETGEIISEPGAEEKVETQKVLLYALKTYLKLMHPFIPFVTERVWREVPKEKGDHKFLMYSRW